jgi:N-acetyl-gamma-glutamylphosphate reductase
MAVIDTPESLGDIDALYEDAFGRSFFVRRDEASDWHVSLAVDKPYALYRVRIGPDEPNSLLTIRVMADIRGKCGAAQLVHALNVMAGFEESVGIDG